jgi:hypothetical protein
LLAPGGHGEQVIQVWGLNVVWTMNRLDRDCDGRWLRAQFGQDGRGQVIVWAEFKGSLGELAFPGWDQLDLSPHGPGVGIPGLALDEGGQQVLALGPVASVVGCERLFKQRARRWRPTAWSSQRLRVDGRCGLLSRGCFDTRRSARSHGHRGRSDLGRRPGQPCRPLQTLLSALGIRLRLGHQQPGVCIVWISFECLSQQFLGPAPVVGRQGTTRRLK